MSRSTRNGSGRRHGIARLLLVAAISVSLSACTWTVAIPWPFPAGTVAKQAGGTQQDDSAPLTVVAITSATDLDPMYASESKTQTIIMHLFSGLARWATDGGRLTVVPDAAEALPDPKEGEDGSVTYRYTIRDDATWSDGRPVTAHDFEYAWKRAAGVGGISGVSPYRNMFRSIRGYSDVPEETDLAVRATDDRHLEVTLDAPTPYWSQLLASPALFPVREDIVESNPRWATDSTSFVSNGAYGMRRWEHATMDAHVASLDLSRREDHYGRADVRVPSITFILQASSEEIWKRYAAGEWPVIISSLVVPSGEDEPVVDEKDIHIVISPQIGTRFLFWDMSKSLVPGADQMSPSEYETAQSDVRRALSLLIDRGGYLSDYDDVTGYTAAASVVAPGIQEAGGYDFSSVAGHGEGFVGYYDTAADAYERNREEAMATLADYYETDEEGRLVGFPQVTLASTMDDTLCQSVVKDLNDCGIPARLKKVGDYSDFAAEDGALDVGDLGDMIWIADYADPVAFLELWSSDAISNYCGLGRGAHAEARAYSIDLTDIGYDVKVDHGTWAETYDRMLAIASTEKDTAKRFKLLHRIEDLLMETGAVCPLLYCVDSYIVGSGVDNLLVTPLGYKVFSYATVSEPSTGSGD